MVLHKYPTCILLIALLLVIGCCRSALASGEEQITYLMEDFERNSPGIWPGIPQVHGSVTPELGTVHSGKRAVKLNWDFSDCPETGGRFANFTFHREMLGRPKAMRLWIHAGDSEKGTPLVLWVSDSSNEMYTSSLAVDWTGWKQVTIPIATSPAWASGDKNHKHDPPMKLYGLAVNYGGPIKGSLIIDDLEIVTDAVPREALGAYVGSDVPHDLFWEAAPLLITQASNGSGTVIPGVRFDVKVTDSYSGRQVWQKTLMVGNVPAHGDAKATADIDLPFGVYIVEWSLLDSEGAIRNGTTSIARFGKKCYEGLPAPEQDYLRKTSPVGGVFWHAIPNQASHTGARWIRNFGANWAWLEPQPGVYRVDYTPEATKPFLSAGIESVWLMVLYSQPAFRRIDRPDFAPGYGALMANMAKALTGSSNSFELGNEDNGGTKFAYTEVARHGLAGIRSQNPFALVSNSGTAFVDIGWLRMQGDRGLFDRLDVVCVHPYTITSSPEEWGVYEQAQQVVGIGDELGGMKRFWTTEWGYSESPSDQGQINARQRADYIPRHYLIGVAAGYEKHGIYSFDGNFGIYNNGRPYTAAASVHAMAKTLEGYRFAGTLERGPDVWAMVWEKFGKPVLVAWSPSGGKTWSVDVGTAKVRALDLFGNPIPAQVEGGKLTLNLTTGPQYVIGCPASVTEAAWRANMRDLRLRFARHLEKTALKSDEQLSAIAKNEKIDLNALSAALERVSTAYPNAPRLEVSGVQADLLRMLLLAARTGQLRQEEQVSKKSADPFMSAAKSAITSAIERDVDLTQLRWAITEFDYLDCERRFAESSGDKAFAGRLLAAQSIVARFATKYLMGKSSERLVAVWPYLYTLGGDGETLQEKLTFIPGKPTEVRARVNSYALNEYKARLTLAIPAGWTAEPKVREIAVPAGKHVETSFTVTSTAATQEKPKIVAGLEISGKPGVEIPFDDVEIASALRVVAEPVAGLLPETPLRLTLTNMDEKPLSGRIRLLREGQTTAIARAEFAEISPGKSAVAEMKLRDDTPVPPNNEWALEAEILQSDGRTGLEKFKADFACATYATSSPTIDGNLSDWKDAAPLHLDRPEYAKGTFGNSWSPDDCSATTYLKWDEKNLYFAAVVNDQTFSQNLRGKGIWAQDSIQIAFANDDQASRVEFGLALTSAGEEAFRYTQTAGNVSGVRAKIIPSPGRITYEAAIPWSELPGLGAPEKGKRLRFSVLVNDDDAIVPRRYLERYDGIALSKDIQEYGQFILLGVGQLPTATTEETDIVLKEDFEEYADGGIPDAWRRLVHLGAVPAEVRAGVGRNGSKALTLSNTVGAKPGIYTIFARPIENLDPGGKYELHAWVRGKNVSVPGTVIRVSSDLYGNQGFNYAAWEPGDEWQEVVFAFSAPGTGRMNVVVRNTVAMDNLVIDDIEIRKAGETK